MKTTLLIIWALIGLISSQANSQSIAEASNASDYLILTSEQQKINLGRYLNANKDIATQCQPGWSLDKSNEYFIAWVTNNPQFLRRNLTSAFSAALLHSCNVAPKH